MCSRVSAVPAFQAGTVILWISGFVLEHFPGNGGFKKRFKALSDTKIL
jgi:hypothetical protein